MLRLFIDQRFISYTLATSRASIRKFSLLFSFLLLSWVSSANALDAIHQSWTGKAIDGYDPVAYFTIGKPTEGVKDFQYEWNDATWYFASERNLEKFKASPEKYAPQYGGYCAWAVSQGYTASTDPTAWEVHDGKLYLNYNKSVRQTWLKDKESNIVAGDNNWPELLRN
ncbi:MAG: YHS domain-containing (seleno)protein [Granulosicoccus sp.]